MPVITIVIKLKVEGIHRFPDAPKLFPSVAYLQYPHRHTFHIECEFRVTHTERDKEFIETKHQIENYLKQKYYSPEFSCHDFGNMSCESIAEDLYNQFIYFWGDSSIISCTVGEDGEFMAKII